MENQMKTSLLALVFAVLGSQAFAIDLDFDEVCAADETVSQSSGGYVCTLTDDCMKEHVGRGKCPSSARGDAEAVCLLNSESKKSCKRENAVCTEE